MRSVLVYLPRRSVSRHLLLGPTSASFSVKYTRLRCPSCPVWSLQSSILLKEFAPHASSGGSSLLFDQGDRVPSDETCSTQTSSCLVAPSGALAPSTLFPILSHQSNLTSSSDVLNLDHPTSQCRSRHDPFGSWVDRPFLQFRPKSNHIETIQVVKRGFV